MLRDEEQTRELLRSSVLMWTLFLTSFKAVCLVGVSDV